jgi:glutamate racemase
MEQMPNESVVYFGDTARAPYGVHSKETITAYSMDIMRYLTAKPLKMVIIACNTICVSSYYELAEAFNVPLFEIVSCAAEECVIGVPREGANVGVIATEATVRSGGYLIELLKRHPFLNIIQKPCPDLVTFAEKGFTHSVAARQKCAEYLRDMKEAGIERLVMGCTHFPLYADIFAEYLGGNVKLIDPAVASAAKVKGAIREAGLENPGPPKREFYITGDTDTFERVAGNLLGMEIKAERVTL